MHATVLEALAATADAYPDRPAQGWRTAAGWQTRSWADYRDLVFRAAAGLVRLGVEPGSGVTILSANRPDWAIADLAAIAAGAIPAGVFVTNTPEQCAYVIEHTRASVAVVDTLDALAKLEAVRERLLELRSIVLFDGDSAAPGVVSWTRLLELGAEAGEGVVRERIAAQRSEDVATLIYTSGTTGTPKGVELTHRNLIWTAETAVQVDFRFGPDDRQLSYLPLAHIAEQMLSIHIPLQSGETIYFVPALEQVAEALAEVRPTIFFAVPRVWEKLQSRVEAALEAAPPLRRRLIAWARGRGRAAGVRAQAGLAAPWSARLADRLVLEAIRARLGLDRVRFAASAAAPISLGTLEFFQSLGIPILEIYGLSETSGPGTISRPARYRLGRVGTAMTGVEVKTADDGEILFRGPNIFRGYRSDPAATAAVLEPDGWFHTGDIGVLDDDGFLRITDRKKELIVTSGGKKLAPAPIESRLREITGVAHAVILGDERNFVAALLTLDPAALPGLASRLGSAARSLVEASCCPRVRDFLAREIERVNGALARYESIRRFELLATEFSVDGGELTPTLKLRRKIVHGKYAETIERLYTVK